MASTNHGTNELRQILSLTKVDIVCVSETWLNEKISDSVVNIDGYNMLRHDRIGRLGGGIMIYIRKGLKYKTLKTSENQPGIACTEYISVEISLHNNNIFLTAFYNPPEIDCSYLIDDLLSKYGSKYKNIFLAGDFNTNLLNENSTKTARLKTALSIFSMYSLGDEPTFFHRNGSSQLDLIISNVGSKVLRFNQVEIPVLSHHDLIFASLDFDINVVPHLIQYRDYNAINAAEFTDAFQSFNWMDFYRINNSDMVLDLFNSIMIELHDEFVPIRTFETKRKINEWMNNTIRKAIIDRDLAYKQWKVSNSPDDKILYKRLRNKVIMLIRKAKETYYGIDLNPRLSSRDLWKKIKNIGVGRQKEQSENNFTADEINNCFAQNFSSSHSQYFHNSTGNPSTAFTFEHISETEIVNAIFKVKSNAVGLDLLPLKFLKSICPLIVKPIMHIFNTITETCQFPLAWKKSKIIPIMKKPALNTINNLRPISILCALSKVFEQILKKQICEFVQHYDLLSEFQSGYRPKHSTKTAMLKVFDDIGIIIDNGRPVVLVLLDYSKAFDTISHRILCNKLQSNFGFSTQATRLMQSYLLGRTQTVFNNGIYSKYIPIHSGVPQGSILGPILFSLYINDLPNELKYCKIHIFADDVQIYFDCTGRSASEISRKVNEDLTRIFNWSSKNMLTLNINKTNALFINNNNSNWSLKPDIFLNNRPIEFTESAVSLGITIQSNFGWDKYVLQQCGKIYACLRSLHLTSSFLNIETKLRLFKTLILPYFIACDFLLSETSAFALSKLRVALNACVRFVFKINRYNSVSHFQHRLIGCPFKSFGQMRCCQMIFKLANLKKPDYLFNKLQPLRSTRSQKYVFPRHRTSKYGNSFFVRGVATWNSLPNELTLEKNAVEFKRKCIEHFRVL